MNLEPLAIAMLVGAVVLPLIGILMVLFALGVFVSPRGARLRETTQKIKGFGLDVEVSVLTLFVLIGLTFSLAGIYLIVRDYEKKVSEVGTLRLELARAERDFSRALAQAKQIDVTALVTLQEPGGAPPLPDDLRCRLHVFAGSTRQLRVDPGVKPLQYYVNIDNISPAEVIRALECLHPGSNRRWALENFNPLQPEYQLRKD